MKGMITDIKRFAVHDGEGIRTTVFFKGCPLQCIWCHNPETVSGQTEMAYYAHKCVSCGACAAVCGNHKITEGTHVFNREGCTFCEKCETVCQNEALKLQGREMTVEQVLEAVLQDKLFYDTSNGGVTLSGGECLLQAEFCAELLKLCKQKGIQTAVDTCGFVSKEKIDLVLPYTDVFLYDIKAIEERVHIQCTGRSNALILDNLRYITAQHKKVEIRFPYVPGYNDSQTEKIAAFLQTLQPVPTVKILPFHNFAASKYQSLDRENGFSQIQPPTQEQLNHAADVFQNYGIPIKHA